MDASAYDFGRGRTIRLRAELPTMLPDSTNKAWIHLATRDVWEGHAMGTFEFDDKVFERIMANFDAQKNPIPLTYEHPDKVSGQPIPAAGWIHALEVRADGLWAFAEFTRRSADHVREGEYRFCSVVVDFESQDRQSGDEIGPELFEVGLTNTPFIDGQTPIALTRQSGTQRTLSMKPEKALAKARDAFGLGEDAGYEEIANAAKATADLLGAQSGSVEETVEDVIDEITAASADTTGEDVIEASVGDPVVDNSGGDAPNHDALLREIFLTLQDTTGLDGDSILATLQSKAAELTELLSATDQTTVNDLRVVANSRIDALDAKVAEKDAKIAELTAVIGKHEGEAAERRIDDAVASGHVLAASREKLCKLARKAPELLDEFLGEAADKPAIPTKKVIKASAPTATGLVEVSKDDEEYKTYDRNLRFVKDPDKRHQIILTAMAKKSGEKAKGDK